VPIK
jgi:IS5 family transposase